MRKIYCRTSRISILLFMFLFSMSITQGCIRKIPEGSVPLYLETLGSGLKIPKGFKSYTLFYATSVSYVDKISIKEQKELKRVIINFGKSIGKENLAVWVREDERDRLNVEQGKTYLDRIYGWYGEKYQYYSGPFLVFYTCHPDERPKQKDFIGVMSFGNKAPEYIVQAVEYLEGEIRRGNVSKADIINFDYWTDLKSFVSKQSQDIKELLINVISGKRK